MYFKTILMEEYYTKDITWWLLYYLPFDGAHKVDRKLHNHANETHSSVLILKSIPLLNLTSLHKVLCCN